MDEILQPSIVNRYIISEHDSPLYSCNGHRARDVDYFFLCGVSIYFTSVNFLTFYVKNAPIGESVFCARYL